MISQKSTHNGRTTPSHKLGRTVLMSCVGFLAGFGAVLVGLSMSGLFDDRLPPASPEFAEFIHQNITWSSECERFIDTEQRMYDPNTGTLTYPWLGTAAQEAVCWKSSPPLVTSVTFVTDPCDECSDPPPDTCQVHLRGTGVEGLTPEMLLTEHYLGEQLPPTLNDVAIWSGTTAQLNECDRYVSIDPTVYGLPSSGSFSSFSIVLEAQLN